MKKTKYLTISLLICLLINLFTTSVFAEENRLPDNENNEFHTAEEQSSAYQSIPLALNTDNILYQRYNSNGVVLVQVQPRASGIFIFLGGWLAGEVINGVFRAVTGTTPADITFAAITKAVNYITGKGTPSSSCNAYFDKNGNPTNTAGCGFGGSSGGSWRLRLAE